MSNISRRLLTQLLLPGLMWAVHPDPARAQATPSAPATPAAPERDGQHDFDFEFGSWKARLSRLLHPLTGSTTWVDYEGTSVVRKVWNGRANLGELEVEGSEAFVAGFRRVMLACAVLALLSALGSWLLIGGKPEAPDK